MTRTAGHFDPLMDGVREDFTERFNKLFPDWISQIPFDFIQSSNYDGSATSPGFKIDTDGSAYFGSGLIIGSDIYSANWDGAIPANVPDGSATAGYYLDYSLGAAQFENIYALGGQLGDLTLTGTLTLDGTGEIITDSAGNERLVISQADDGRLDWIDASGETQATIGLFDPSTSSAGLLLRGYSSSAGQTGLMDLLRYTGGSELVIASPTTSGGVGRILLGTVGANGTTVTEVMSIRQNKVKVVQPLLTNSGSAGAPAIGLEGSGDDTGFYFGIDQVFVATQGTRRASWSTTVFGLAVDLDLEGNDILNLDQSLANADAVGTPAYSWEDSPSSGLFRAADEVPAMAANGGESMRWTEDGPSYEVDGTKLPAWAEVAPSNFNPTAASTWETATGSTTTVWTHQGDNRTVILMIWMKCVASNTGTAQLVSIRPQYSLDGGSTWNNPPTSTQAYTGSDSGGIGAADQVPMYNQDLITGTATGDVQFRLQFFRAGTITNFIQIHGMARAEQTH